MKQIPRFLFDALLMVGITGSIAGCAFKQSANPATPMPGAAMNRTAALDKTESEREEFLIVAQDGPRQYSRTWSGGSLLAIIEGAQRPMPIQATEINARVVAYIATITVAQRFQNPFTSSLDAVYLFPLPANAALNDFVMTIGSRHIRGVIRERAEAEKIYAAAKRQGYTASLLNEEQAGVFSQSIANIEPGKVIETQITYFHTLTLTNGWWQFVFPIAPDSPNHGDFSLNLSIDAGVPITNQECKSHQIITSSASPEKLSVSLVNSTPVTNADFVFRYQVSGIPESATNPTRNKDTNNAARALWALSKMNELLSSTSTPEQIAQIRCLALDHNLLTPVSAFLSIDTSQTTTPKIINP